VKVVFLELKTISQLQLTTYGWQQFLLAFSRDSVLHHSPLSFIDG